MPEQEESKVDRVSFCCGAPIVRVIVSETPQDNYYMCSSCDTPCETRKKII